MGTKKMAICPKGGEEMYLCLTIGALCDPVAKQLRAQKLKFDPGVVKHIQQDITAYVRLKVRYHLGMPLQEKIMKQIWEKVAKHVAELN